VIDRALRFDKEQRWPNARGMQVAVRQLAAEGTSALPDVRADFTGLDTVRLPVTSTHEVSGSRIAALRTAADWGNPTPARLGAGTVRRRATEGAAHVPRMLLGSDEHHHRPDRPSFWTRAQRTVNGPRR